MKLKHKGLRQARAKASTVAVLLILGSCQNALAWGIEAHRVVAEIAEQYLEVTTAKQVRELLSLENVTTLADISFWADQIRMQRGETARWHFVDIPIRPEPGTPAAYDSSRDCPQGNCVVAKINEFAAVIANREAPLPQRLEALKFVVHFVADIHQPLHCANNNDAGGNGILVEFNGRRTNLHAVWDTDILGPAVQGDERGYARKLAGSISETEAALWRGGSPEDWANESYRIAAGVIYAHTPETSGVLPASYETDMLPIVNDQLRHAGVRLAAVLNAALAAKANNP